MFKLRKTLDGVIKPDNNKIHVLKMAEVGSYPEAGVSDGNKMINDRSLYFSAMMAGKRLKQELSCSVSVSSSHQNGRLRLVCCTILAWVRREFPRHRFKQDDNMSKLSHTAGPIKWKCSQGSNNMVHYQIINNMVHGALNHH